MPFTEIIKKEVKTKAHYKCCLCESFKSIEVHHITPEGEGGLNEIDNAAPLCATCHADYGANPEKRKWIREKRDFWYDFCEKRLYYEDINQLEKTSAIIEDTKKHYEKRIETVEKDIKVLQTTFQFYSNHFNNLVSSIEQTPVDKKQEVFTEINTISSVVTSSACAINELGKGIYGFHEQQICPKCGARVSYYLAASTDSIICPSCKNPIW